MKCVWGVLGTKVINLVKPKLMLNLTIMSKVNETLKKWSKLNSLNLSLQYSSNQLVVETGLCIVECC